MVDSPPGVRGLPVVLADVVGAAHVLTADDLMAPYLTDWTRRFAGPARAVVRPASAPEVGGVLRACRAAGVPVVVQGGNTGLVGGSVPSADARVAPVVVSTRRLDALGEVDRLAGQVTAGAGATLGDVQRHVARAGWRYGVDLAARDSATIGGTVATNAGGIHVVAYGMTRAQVVGVEAVLADGSVVSHLSGLVKDNTGYDLGALVCGSEGTLAVITAVRLRLHRPERRTTVALIGCQGFADALDRIAQAVTSGTRLIAAEALDAGSLDVVCRVAGLPHPLEAEHPVVLLLEVADGGDGSGLRALDEADTVVAVEPADRARLWRYREGLSEAYSSLGIVHKLDVSVPLARLADCAAELHATVGAFPTVETFGMFGHLGDGNLHLEILGPDAGDDAVDRAVLSCVAGFGGSISAEHGIGRAKAAFLDLSRSPEEIAAMRAIKAAWDPDGILNPGVLLT